MKAADWLDLGDRVALVTGAASGIGAAIATALAGAGARVVVSDVNGSGAGRVAADIGGLGLELDVSDSAAVDRVVDHVQRTCGRLDVLVNNAGIYSGYGGPLLGITDQAWRKLWSVNVDGVFYCSRAAARVMVAAGRGGRIINVASTQAVSPGVGVTYDGSKAAVVQITRTLALELAPHGINVNALAPGPTWVREGPAPALDKAPVPSGEPLADTIADRLARLPLGHWGEPMEQGKAAVFLASAMSDFVTGAYLPVDGGWLLL